MQNIWTCAIIKYRLSSKRNVPRNKNNSYFGGGEPRTLKNQSILSKKSEPFSSRSLMRSHTPLKALLFLPCAEGQLGKRHTLLCKTRMPKLSRAMMSKCGSCTEHIMILPKEGRPAGVGFTHPTMLFKQWAYQLVRYGATPARQATDRPFST